MQIRYSKTYSGLMLGIGSLLLLLNLALAGVGELDSIGTGMGAGLLGLGAFSWGRTFALIEDDEFALKNLLGFKMRRTPVSRLVLEPTPKGKSRLYRIKDNGKRQRLITLPHWAFDRADTDVFMSGLASASVFD